MYKKKTHFQSLFITDRLGLQGCVSCYNFTSSIVKHSKEMSFTE